MSACLHLNSRRDGTGTNKNAYNTNMLLCCSLQSATPWQVQLTHTPPCDGLLGDPALLTIPSCCPHAVAGPIIPLD